MNRIFSALMICALSTACTLSPTGRRQFMVVDNDKLIPAAAKTFEAMKKQ